MTDAIQPPSVHTPPGPRPSPIVAPPMRRIRNWWLKVWLRWKYGVRGDGLHDDTEALQRYIDETTGVIRLPDGIYRIEGTLRA